MAEPISIQQLKDASLDVKSLEEVINGDEDVVVTTRLGETYPSIKGSIKKVFENGGLPATPFSTYDDMASSALVDGDYAFVTNEVDTEKNGVYEKIDGVWVHSQYNPKAYTDKINDMRIIADSAQIAASADLLEPSAENLQFEMLDGNKQVLRIENDKLYADIHTLDGEKLTNASLNVVRTVYDLYSVGNDSSRNSLEVYDDEELITDLANNNDGSADDSYISTESIFYMDAEQLKYADAEDSYIVDTTAQPLNTVPFTPKACLAVTDNQWFKTGQSVVTLGANGCQYPNPNKVLVIVPSYGQSLSVGSQGVPPISLVNPQPNHALMFNGVNARLDSSGNLGRTPLTDFSRVTDFEPVLVKNNTSDARDDLSKEMMHIPFAQKVSDVLAVENDAPIRLLSFAAGVGGTPLDLVDFPQYEQEGLGLKKGSNAYTNLINAILKAKELAEAKGWSVVVPTILFQHGEADASNANYALRLNTLISDLNTDIKNITGQTQGVRFSAMLKANHYAFGTVGLEQMMQVGENNALFNIIGSTYPAEPALWADDFTHRSARGYNYMGYMYAKSFVHELKRGFDSFGGLSFKDATVSGNEITVNFNVPVEPIQYKTTDIVLADPSWGFRVVRDGLEMGITNVQINSNSSVVITLASTPTSAITLSCAMYGHSGTPTLESIPRSNIADSDTGFGLTKGGDSTENWLIPFTTTIDI